MNNVFVCSLFTVFTLYILGRIVAFSLYEIRNEQNFWGAICMIVLTIGSVVFSNVMVWIS